MNKQDHKNLMTSVLKKYPDYEVVIGCETHVQLKTKSKMFCGCTNQFGAAPNTNICKVCTGMLGSLPVLNIQAVNYVIAAGLATNCTIAKLSEFARKHYCYPDLPKNYQISQDDKPICTDGYINIEGPSGSKKIRIKRIHMEEDAGKLLHDDKTKNSLLDLNRAGTPLIEIVTEPDLSSADEAVNYLQTLKSIVEYIDVTNANMEEGSFRADVNISVKKRSAEKLGTKVELKNINSFRFIHDAIEFEIERQINLVENGKKVTQETRLWDNEQNKTVFMRSKENAEDYRYLPDPDLPRVIVDDEWIRRISEKLPELPKAKAVRFEESFGLSKYEAEIICSDRDLSIFFEEVAKKSNLPKKATNWILRDLLAYLKDKRIKLKESLISPDMLSELLLEIDKGVINSNVAQEVFIEMADSGRFPSIIIQEKGLNQIGSDAELQPIVEKVIAKFPNQSQEFANGNERIFGFLVGQAMKELGGKGNPSKISELLKKTLLKQQ